MKAMQITGIIFSNANDQKPVCTEGVFFLSYIKSTVCVCVCVYENNKAVLSVCNTLCFCILIKFLF